MLANIARQSTGTVIEPAEPTVWTSSKCWYFTDSYIYKEFDVIEPVFPASNNFTYSFWVYLNELTYSGGWGESILYLAATSLSGTQEYNLVGSVLHYRQQNEQKLKLYRSNHSVNPEYISMESGSWVNITLTGTDASSNALKVYKDGSLALSTGNGTNDFNLNASSRVAPFKFQIGINPTFSYNPSGFYISELGVWDVALDAGAVAVISASVIDWNSNSGSYDNANDLVAYYRFGNGTGDNPASRLHDETNSDHVASESDGDRDLTSVVGTINEVNTSSVGTYPINQSS
tara:strand:+ start:373 stop:1239 length:867 start_codon:yes stop_codon:yes gene_type:complete